MKKLTLSFLLTLLPLLASADAVEIDGIYYILISKAKEAIVTSNPNDYKGDIVIPETIIYKNNTYKVTEIKSEAFAHYNFLDYQLKSVNLPKSIKYLPHALFLNRAGLKSIKLPEELDSMADSVFFMCESLETIIIPISLKSIGGSSFNGCSSLKSVQISDLEAWNNISFNSPGTQSPSNPLMYAHHLYLNGEEIKDLVIPDNVSRISDYTFAGCDLNSISLHDNISYIGSCAFIGCKKVCNVNIPNSMKSIGDYAFQDCTGLTSVTIPNSVTSIGWNAFGDCTGLTSVTISNSVTSLGGFSGCTGLTSITIPNSVTSLGGFSGCSGLTTITIGNGVKTIYGDTFAQCPELTDVYCMAEELSSTYTYGLGPLYTDASAFDGSYIEYATLHVPESAIEAYKTTAPWSGFGKFVTLSGEESETPKCAMPSINMEEGKIKVSCETEGVEFVSNVSATDTRDYYDAELTLTYKYKVSVYATKNGYENSDTATREIVITDNGKAILVGDVDGDGVVNVADHVKLSDIIMGK